MNEYPYVYINYGKTEDKDKDCVWTCYGNESEYSRNTYRPKVWRTYTKCELDQSRAGVRVYVGTKGRQFQRIWNMLFKPWCNSKRKQLIELPCKIDREVLKRCAEVVVSTMPVMENGQKISKRLKAFDEICRHIPAEVITGYIYLMQIGDDKYKIGYSKDPYLRATQLQLEYDKPVKIIDYKQTDNEKIDEAKLHIINAKYKSPDNGKGEQTHYADACSELFELRGEVVGNWNKFWKHKEEVINSIHS